MLPSNLERVKKSRKAAKKAKAKAKADCDEAILSSAGSSEEAGQRLYESALLAAWREAEALGSLPLGVQRRPDTVRRAEALRDRVEDLARQDEDVRRRAERFLGA